MKVIEVDTESSSTPPKKKLKQASLPFQILNPVGGEPSSNKKIKKRKLSEGSADCKTVKVVKPNEQDFHNETGENQDSNLPKESKSGLRKGLTKKTDNNSFISDRSINCNSRVESSGSFQVIDLSDGENESSDVNSVNSDESNSTDKEHIAVTPTVSSESNGAADVNKLKNLSKSPSVDESVDSVDKSNAPTVDDDFSVGVSDTSVQKSDPIISRNSMTTPEQKSPSSGRQFPKVKKLTPKKVIKQIETAKKKEEKQKLKQEREKKKAEEKEHKEKLKLEKKEEKEKKKLAELELQRQKVEQKKKEKEEKEKKKMAELEIKNEEKRLKDEERRRKEEQRLLEKRRKDEKKQAEEDAKRKEAAAFISFFRAAKADVKPGEEIKEKQTENENFMPFEVKADMRLAPVVRVCFDNKHKEIMERLLEQQSLQKLYLEELRDKSLTPGSSSKTWPLSVFRDEVVIIDDDDEDMIGSGANVVTECYTYNSLPRPKLLQFYDNRRPPYWGTWRKKSKIIKPRIPLGKDEGFFDYEMDSDDEWEEEEPGESLHGSDDEKESEDEYEVDNEFFVPHGYLSEEENEEEEEESVSPEILKAKLKLLEVEFEEQRKQKTEFLKPKVIGCIWRNDITDSVGSRLLKLLSSHRAVFRDEPIVTSGPDMGLTTGSPGQENTDVTPGSKKRRFPEEAVPSLIKLIHGNINSRRFLVKEFLAYYRKEEAADKIHSEGKNSGVCTGGESSSGTSYLGISKASISNKIRELASWISCPDDGPMSNRMCWYVSPEIRSCHGLSDLAIPNKAWNYHYTPKREVDFLNSPASPAVVPDTNSKVKGSPLITKFTKKMTNLELQKQFSQVGSSSSDGTPKTGRKEPSSVSCTNEAKLATVKRKSPLAASQTVRKRVAILKTVPVGQAIITSPQNVAINGIYDCKSVQDTKELNRENEGNQKSATDSNDELECVVLSD